MNDSGDAGEFDSLSRQYARVVSSAVRRACGQAYRRLIPDAEQEVYLTLWRVLVDGKNIRHPGSYLYKVALRTALGLIRKHGVETPTESEQLESVAERPASATRDEALLAERSRWLEESLERLSAEQALAVRAYLGGHNHAEVAALYGWSESVARHRIYRGIEALKAMTTGNEP